MSKVKFSIITPAYNVCDVIYRCYESIINQTYDNYEWIVIDDGSEDNTWLLLKRYSKLNQQIKVIHQQNAGPSAARNAGLKMAHSDYVLFVDADDYFYSNQALKILDNAINQNPNSELLYFQGNVLLKSGKLYHDTYCFCKYETGLECLEDHCNKRKCIVFGAIYVQCYKLSLLLDNNIQFTNDICYGEDRVFTCQSFLCANETCVIPVTLYTYVVMDGSLMHDSVRQKRAVEDGKKMVYALDLLCQQEKRSCPMLKKYIHNLYAKILKDIPTKDIDYKLLFRNASTLKLIIKDVLFILKIFKY